MQHNGVLLADFPLRDGTWTNLHGGCCVDCVTQEDKTPFAPATGSDAFCPGLHEKCYYPKGQCPNDRISNDVLPFELNDDSAPNFVLGQVMGYCDTFSDEETAPVWSR